MQIVVQSDGTLRTLYGEAIDLATLGRIIIRRASHVEPDEQGKWWADLAPAGGPRLGPFDWRSEALAAERVWIENLWIAAST